MGSRLEQEQEDEDAYDLWPGCCLSITGSHFSDHYSRLYRVSEQLRSLLKVEPTAQLSIGEIEEGLIEYARAHNGISGVVFHYDPVIWSIFDLEKDTVLKFYYLEKCIRKHVFRHIKIFIPIQGTDVNALVELD